MAKEENMHRVLEAINEGKISLDDYKSDNNSIIAREPTKQGLFLICILIKQSWK